MLILHRTEDRRPIAEVPVDSWIWDDRNDEPALFRGWVGPRGRGGCYVATWLSEGDFCMWDTDGSGLPVVLEVLATEEVPQVFDPDKPYIWVLRADDE